MSGARIGRYTRSYLIIVVGLACTAEGGCGVLSESCGRRVDVMAAGSYI